MRRLTIIRKDLHMSAGKLMAMSMHLAEAYWTNLIKQGIGYHNCPTSDKVEQLIIEVDKDILENYVNGIFTKTVCEAKNLNHLKKIEKVIEGLRASGKADLKEGIDYGYINDACLTELKPENEDGTCTVGIWFKPLPDDVSHELSKKYHLYV